MAYASHFAGVFLAAAGQVGVLRVVGSCGRVVDCCCVTGRRSRIRRSLGLWKRLVRFLLGGVVFFLTCY